MLPEEHEYNLKHDYVELMGDRETFLDCAKACSEVTVRSLYPETDNSEELMVTSWQSLGASGVSSLASKLTQVLFPPNVPFFRLAPPEAALQAVREQVAAQAQGDPEAAQQAVEQAQENIDGFLSRYELEAIKTMEKRGDRPKQYEVFQHLLVSGNCLFKDLRNDHSFSVHGLDKYVVKRDDSGQVLRVILHEELSKTTLLSTKQFKTNESLQVYLSQDSVKDCQTFELYTGAYLKDGQYKLVQQVCVGNESPVEVASSSFPLEDLPLRPLRLYSRTGHSYSTSYVLNVLGDLKTLEGTYQAVSEATAAAAKLIFLVSPNSTTDPDAVNSAANGDAIEGNSGDITVLTADGKIRDLQSAYTMIQNLENRVGRAFLISSSVQRDAERVTAQEVTALIKELESQLGGIYSMLAQEFQRPYVKHLLDSIPTGILPKLPKGSVETSVITGAEALGRTEELARVDQLILRATQVPGGIDYLNVGAYLKASAESIGIANHAAFLKTEDEVAALNQQRQQQAMMAEMISKGAGPVASNMTKPQEPTTSSEAQEPTQGE